MVSSGIMLNVIIMATVVSASTQCGLVDGGEREDGQFIWYKSNKMGHILAWSITEGEGNDVL